MRRPTVAPSRSTELDVLDVDDVRRGAPRARPTPGGPAAASRAQGWSSSAPTGAQVSPSHATPARGSQVTPARGALAEGEHVQAVRPPERVRVLEREVDDAVAGADLVADGVLALPLHRDARAPEDVEDLLLGALEVERRRPHPGIDLDPLDAYRLRARARQAPPRACDVAALAAPGPCVVPVRDHAAIMSCASDSRSRVDGAPLRPHLLPPATTPPPPRAARAARRAARGRRPAPVECLDPLEPLEHGCASSIGRR